MTVAANLLKTRLPGYIICSESSGPQKVYSRNLYQKKKTMKRTESPAPIATQDVALREVASFLYWLKFNKGVEISVETKFVSRYELLNFLFVNMGNMGKSMII